MAAKQPKFPNIDFSDPPFAAPQKYHQPASHSNVLNPPGTWTDEREMLLKKYKALGDSASTIARKLGGVSRNAVLGKLSRLGLCEARPASWGSRSTKLKQKRTKPPGFNRAQRMLAIQNLAATLESEGLVELPPDQSEMAVSFFDLETHTCRWPVSGDGRDLDTMKFCGAESHFERPYCLRHCRMAYEPGSR